MKEHKCVFPNGKPEAYIEDPKNPGRDIGIKWCKICNKAILVKK